MILALSLHPLNRITQKCLLWLQAQHWPRWGEDWKQRPNVYPDLLQRFRKGLWELHLCGHKQAGEHQCQYHTVWWVQEAQTEGPGEDDQEGIGQKLLACVAIPTVLLTTFDNETLPLTSSTMVFDYIFKEGDTSWSIEIWHFPRGSNCLLKLLNEFRSIQRREAWVYWNVVPAQVLWWG